LGLARLSKATVISPRSDYEEVARSLAQFEEFHRIGETEANFDPGLQELTVRAVRLFAQADQAVKDLNIQLLPGVIDIVFRGVKIPRHEFEAADWDDLLTKAESELAPITERVRAQKALLQKTVKEENDALVLKEALQAYSNFSVDVGRLQKLQRFRAVVATVGNETVHELRSSLLESLVVSQSINAEQSLVGEDVEGIGHQAACHPSRHPAGSDGGLQEDMRGLRFRNEEQARVAGRDREDQRREPDDAAQTQGTCRGGEGHARRSQSLGWIEENRHDFWVHTREEGFRVQEKVR
jgi:hypothetical protein